MALITSPSSWLAGVRKPVEDLFPGDGPVDDDVLR